MAGIIELFTSLPQQAAVDIATRYAFGKDLTTPPHVPLKTAENFVQVLDQQTKSHRFRNPFTDRTNLRQAENAYFNALNRQCEQHVTQPSLIAQTLNTNTNYLLDQMVQSTSDTTKSGLTTIVLSSLDPNNKPLRILDQSVEKYARQKPDKPKDQLQLALHQHIAQICQDPEKQKTLETQLADSFSTEGVTRTAKHIAFNLLTFIRQLDLLRPATELTTIDSDFALTMEGFGPERSMARQLYQQHRIDENNRGHESLLAGEHITLLFSVLNPLNPEGANTLLQIIGGDDLRKSIAKSANRRRNPRWHSEASATTAAILTGIPLSPINQPPIKPPDNYRLTTLLKPLSFPLARLIRSMSKFGPNRVKRALEPASSHLAKPLLVDYHQDDLDKAKKALNTYFSDDEQTEITYLKSNTPVALNVASRLANEISSADPDMTDYDTVRATEVTTLACLLVDVDDPIFALNQEAISHLNREIITPFLIREIEKVGNRSNAPIWNIMELVSPLWSKETKTEFLDELSRLFNKTPSLLDSELWHRTCLIFGYHNQAIHPDLPEFDQEMAPVIIEKSLALLSNWELIKGVHDIRQLIQVIANLNPQSQNNYATIVQGQFVENKPLVRPVDQNGIPTTFFGQVADLCTTFETKEGANQIATTITPLLQENLNYLMLTDPKRPAPIDQHIEHSSRLAKQLLITTSEELVEPLRNILDDLNGLIPTKGSVEALTKTLRDQLEPVYELLKESPLSATEVNTIDATDLLAKLSVTDQADTIVASISKAAESNHADPLTLGILALITRSLKVSDHENITALLEQLKKIGIFDRISSNIQAQTDFDATIASLSVSIAKQLTGQFEGITDDLIQSKLIENKNAIKHMRDAQQQIHQIESQIIGTHMKATKRNALALADHREQIIAWSNQLTSKNSPVYELRQAALAVLRKMHIEVDLPLPDIYEILQLSDLRIDHAVADDIKDVKSL